VRSARRAGEVRGMAHVTGGGIPGNLARILPEGTAAEIRVGSWPVPHVFSVLAEAGNVPPAEAHEVWNMGLGLLLVVPAAEADAVERALARDRHPVHRVGSIQAGPREVRLTA
jgi:phosphoribosylformylglycinamidine cyclo-ligase